MENKEHITFESGEPEAWVCVCGNRPTSEGFYPCDTSGNEIEPTAKAGWTNLYVCNRCGRIVKQDTLEVVGQNPNPKWLP